MFDDRLGQPHELGGGFLLREEPRGEVRGDRVVRALLDRPPTDQLVLPVMLSAASMPSAPELL